MEIKHIEKTRNQTIAKNTLFLYFRMLFTMGISLYTSRVILETLGISDFGIFNVVGGIIALFSFVNSAMISTTQRFINYEIGCNNGNAKLVFNTSFMVHGIIALILIVLSETGGLWLFFSKIQVPIERQFAAFCTYQLAVITTIILILSVPYNALIIAHEKMEAFAYISIFEVSAKLIVVFILQWINFDRLIMYSVLLLIVQLLVRMLYNSYCIRHFPEAKLHFKWDSILLCKMIKFAGWTLWGGFAKICSTQGLNILLNVFFGPSINAARGIAVQIQVAINNFAQNFQVALNPQITKSYANEEYTYMHKLMFVSTKFTFFLMLFLTFPLFFKADLILQLWLKVVPEYSSIFVRLLLLSTILESLSNPMMVASAATGKIKKYQMTVSLIMLSSLPISYFLLKNGYDSYWVLIVDVVVSMLAFIARFYIVSHLVNINILSYLKKVIFPISLVGIVLCIIVYNIYEFFSNNIYGLLLFVVITSSIIISVVYTLGIDKEERQFCNNKIYSFYDKFKRQFNRG